jgi:uncharacterized protein YndB with AHSA1/START domain
MDRIVKTCTVSNSPEKAFRKFIQDIHAWWPKEYTWSQDKLEEIRIEPKAGGLCTEIGPLGFRCDWGRVTTLVPDHEIELKWQIGPQREPVPNPEKASDLKIEFKQNHHETVVKLEHSGFENYGENHEQYRQMMDSAYGWDYILNCYQKYCNKE